MFQTLGNRIASERRARFVGRSRELRLLATMLGPGSTIRVAFVHGPGGMGKTSLLHEFVARHSHQSSLPR